MRTMVSDDQDVYRVVVVQKRQYENPGAGGQPYWARSETETDTFVYGPYNQIGSARAVHTRETRDRLDRNKARHYVVDSWIEIAETTWKKVT